jgi:hypothetical protein
MPSRGQPLLEDEDETQQEPIVNNDLYIQE